MKLVIAGSRTFNFSTSALFTLLETHRIDLDGLSEIISGGASGIDTTAKQLADSVEIPFRLFSADWDTHGKAAGPIRNAQMAEHGDALLLVWDGASRGSSSMKTEMKKLGKPVYEIVIKSS